jgi:hypothetical protein
LQDSLTEEVGRFSFRFRCMNIGVFSLGLAIFSRRGALLGGYLGGRTNSYGLIFLLRFVFLEKNDWEGYVYVCMYVCMSFCLVFSAFIFLSVIFGELGMRCESLLSALRRVGFWPLSLFSFLQLFYQTFLLWKGGGGG